MCIKPSLIVAIHLLMIIFFTSAEKQSRVYDGKYHHFTSSMTSNHDRSWFDNTHRANEQQVKQFISILYNRLNLPEPPNVTTDVNDGTGLPSWIVQQLKRQAHKQQGFHHNQELNFQKAHDDVQASAERAIVPADWISATGCQRQLAARLHLNERLLSNIECFYFTKSSMASQILPIDQSVRRLRFLLKREFFDFQGLPFDSVKPEMFHIYQVFRPASNDTSIESLPSLSGTQRLPVNDVQLADTNWLELSIGPFENQKQLQEIYQQFLLPLYGLAINRRLSMATSYDSWSPFRRYDQSQRAKSKFFRSEEVDTRSNPNSTTLYMLVEYEKKQSSMTNHRNKRAISMRPRSRCDSKSICCRQQLIIDLDQNQPKLNFIIYPRKIDIGQCTGICGVGGSSLKHTETKNSQHRNEPHAGHNFLLLHAYRTNQTGNINGNNPDPSMSSCCSYSRTGGLELLYRTSDHGPIIRKYIPNIIVEDCKCGLKATVQQQAEKS